MTLIQFKKSVGKSSEWLRTCGVKDDIISKFGDISIDSIKKYEEYTNDLLFLIEEAYMNGKLKTRDFTHLFNAKNHKNAIVCANCLLKWTIFKNREPFDFFVTPTMKKLEAIKEIILSQKT